MSKVLEMYAIYNRPADYPESYIIRRWQISSWLNAPVPDHKFFFQSDNLETCREMMLTMKLFNLGRTEFDDPVIVETWV